MSADGATVERLLDVPSQAAASASSCPIGWSCSRGRPRSAARTSTSSSPRSGRSRRRRGASTRASSLSATRCSPASARAAAPRSTLATWDRELAIKALALRDHRAEAARVCSRSHSPPGRASSAATERLASSTARARGRQDEEEFIAELQARLAERPRARLLGPRPAPRRAGDRRATDASCASTAPRASSASPCSPCCSPSARRSPRSAGALPLMLLDDVMSELDGERRELLLAASSPVAGRA